MRSFSLVIAASIKTKIHTRYERPPTNALQFRLSLPLLSLSLSLARVFTFARSIDRSIDCVWWSYLRTRHRSTEKESRSFGRTHQPTYHSTPSSSSHSVAFSSLCLGLGSCVGILRIEILQLGFVRASSARLLRTHRQCSSWNTYTPPDGPTRCIVPQCQSSLFT